MNPFALRTIGTTGLQVTTLGCGTATVGDMRAEIPEAQSDLTLEAAYASGIGYFDTAPWYGSGKSEHRIGRVLRTKPRESYVLSTKIGRVFFRPPDPATFERRGAGLPFELRFDYTREGVFRSYEDSLQRLGIPAVDALLIHDLDAGYHGEDGVAKYLDQLSDGGGYAALEELKRTGHIRAIGAGINVLGMVPRFLERFSLDFFLIAMPYTLLSQDALERELPLCQERGAGVVIGAPFASGPLARMPEASDATYGYRPPESPIVDKARRIEAVCRRHGVPLGAAALQFPLAHPAVASIIPGPNAVDQVRQNLAWMRHDVPAQLWAELKDEGLIRRDAPTPG
jgi:D-threo-aldose 1-dehydrogenase